MRFLITFALFFTGAAFNEQCLAQDSKPVLSYKDHMTSCLEYAEKKEPEGVFGSSIDRAFARAMCQCRYEHLPASGNMTKNQYLRAAAVCLGEQEKDLEKFSIKYLNSANKTNQ